MVIAGTYSQRHFRQVAVPRGDTGRGRRVVFLTERFLKLSIVYTFAWRVAGGMIVATFAHRASESRELGKFRA